MPEAQNIRDPIAHLRLFTLKQVREITGYSANHICRRMRAGTFPQRIKIGINSSRWYAAEIERWVAACRRAPPPGQEQHPAP